jgi:hypothetical protein
LKQLTLLAGILFSGAILTSCGSQSEKAAENELAQLGNYLDSVKAAAPVYTEEGWGKIKTEYNNTIEKVAKSGSKLSDEANKKLERAKVNYNEMKEDYAVHIHEAKEKAEISEFRQNLRSQLFGEEKIGTDMQFNFVTGKNALAVYERFVNTVKANQNKYSREDWDEIKLLYEALDTRKNEIEKDLPTADNLNIAKLKVQFATINAVKRPLAKVDENDDAKK